jgi:hypothetical protein
VGRGLDVGGLRYEVRLRAGVDPGPAGRGEHRAVTAGGGAAQRYQLVLPNGASATYASKTEALAAMSALTADRPGRG